jgi:hypothetical protein
MTELKDRFAKDCEFAATALLDRGSIAPMFIVHCDLGLVPVLASFSNTKEKALTYDFIELLCVAYDATAVVMMTEAWMAQEHGTNNPLPPSEREDRVEVLIVTMAARGTNGREEFHSCREIIRDKQDQLIGLKPENPPYDGIRGALFELLPSEPATAQQKAAAQATLKDIGATPESMKPIIH